MAEARKEEAEEAKTAATEGTTAVLGGTGGEEMEERREKTPDEMTNWKRVADLVRADLGEGLIVEEAMWQAVVLIPKGKKDYRGIGLMELMWKVVEDILNRRLTASITFHKLLHGFLAGRGTGTATLEAKLLQQLAALGEEFLCVKFLELHKVYDALDCSRCLEILEVKAWSPEHVGSFGLMGGG